LPFPIPCLSTFSASGPHEQIPLAARDSAVWEAPVDSRGAYGHAHNNSQQYGNAAPYPTTGAYDRGYEEEDLDADRRYQGNGGYEDYNRSGDGNDNSYPSYAPQGARRGHASTGSEAFYAK